MAVAFWGEAAVLNKLWLRQILWEGIRKRLRGVSMIDLESKFFARSHPDFQKLIPYGFQKFQEGYRYSVNILGQEFRVEICISFDGILQGCVYETMTGEEYRNIRIEGMNGAFVGKVREAYGQILQAIRQNCYIDDYFSAGQANRIARLIQEKYGVRPEFLWDKAPEHGVFRNLQNQKWFGIIMYVARNKITVGEGKIDVLAIKAAPDAIGTLLGRDGIYPAYHLNKKNWISIILDESLADEDIMRQVEASYRIVQGKGKKGRQSPGMQAWLVPANPHYFDLEHAFAENQEIIWKQSTNVAVDDQVFLYVTAPVSAILYQCRVTAVDIPYAYESHQIKIRRVMRLRLLKQYDPLLFSLPWLKEQEITTVRGPMHITDSLHIAMRDRENSKKQES